MTSLPAPTKTAHSILRWSAFMFGYTICAWALVHHVLLLPLREIAFLSVVTAVLGLRSVVTRRGISGAAAFYHTPGEMVVLIALLRDGPDAALAVYLLANLLALPLHRGKHHPDRISVASNLVFYPALFWLGGALYEWLGGHRLLTIADCALFFQHPAAIFLPLLALMVFVHELVNRPYLAALHFYRNGEPMRQTLCSPLFSLFDYVEAMGACLILLLWTAWGWGTLPFTLLLNENLLLSARGYFERLDARREAECDPLTGLASWRGLENFLHRSITRARATRASFAVLFLDADNLKLVNDQFGHAAGDELLRLIGECCRLHAREHDLVGRRGGDEFLLVLNGLDRSAGEKVQERLKQAILDTLSAHPRFGRVAGISVGLAVFPEDGREAQALVAIADSNMYADKRTRKSLARA